MVVRSCSQDGGGDGGVNAKVELARMVASSK